MNRQTNGSTARTSAAAARGALLALALAACGTIPTTAAAQDAKPTGTVEAGAGNVSQGSFKAGEYNGLEKKGLFFIADVDLRDNAAYNSDSAFRWRIKGTDLGLATRNIFVQVGVQGTYRFRFGYDGLLRNRSDSYQTPYNGAGTSTLTLPGAWLVPTVAASGGANAVSARGLVHEIGDAPYISTLAANNGALVNPTPAQIALVDAAANADVPLFHHVDLSTKRDRYEAGFNFIVNPRWIFDANFRPEHKDGLKPMGTVSRNIPAGSTTATDISTVIPDRIDSNTNQLSLSLTYKGSRSFAQAGYYGSFFRNNVSFMSWQNWATQAGTINTISSPPSNDFNQINATGGFNFSSTTKLVVSGSYAHNTQNDPFITNPTTPVVPVTSLNGLVVTTAFNARLTLKPVKPLNLTAAYRFDNRDNRTAINIYQYADAEENPSANANFPAGPNNPYGAVFAQNANANRPYSKRLNQASFDADYAIAKRQWIKGSYLFEKIDRACPGAWIDCADASTTHEQTLRAEWRANFAHDVTARVSYAGSWRRAPDYNENAFLALVPYANICPVTSVGCVSALAFMIQNGWTGWGPALGFAPTTGNMDLFFPSNNALNNTRYANNNRISELVGMRRYYVSDRNRGKLRSLLTWQAGAQLAIQGGVDLTKDTYPDAIYGLQDAKGWAANLDGTYTPTDALSVNVFYTYENQHSTSAGNTYTANSNVSSINNGQPGVVGLSGNSCDPYTTLQQRNNNNKLDPCLNWSAAMLDKVNTLGVGLTKKAEKLELTGTFILSRARWDNNVSGGSWANNLLNGPGAPPTNIAAYFIPATPLPTVVEDMAELRLNGRYSFGRGQAVRVAYAYQHMNSSDWVYEGMQFGSLSAQLPTSEQPFHYSQNVIGVSYILTF
jgi:MtrB/PioB family decaheme-associated outer membrane protein